MSELERAARDVAAAVKGRGLTVAAAESVTAGSVAIALAAAPDASDWFAGSIVAYRTAAKRKILGVSAQRVISEECARQMAMGALRVTGADAAVAVTGVGGPDPEEGEPAGTVIICAGTGRGVSVFRHEFDGEPEDVVEQAALHALRHLVDAVNA